MKRKVAKAKKRDRRAGICLIKKLYETYALGKLEEKRFEMLSAGYEKEQDELEQALASDQASLDLFNEDTERADKFLALAKKYTDFSELTAPMINEFVEKIVVHAPDRSTGERIQEIEIYLKSSANLTCPCRSLPRRSWQRRKSAARSASATMRSICGRRNARKRLPRGRSCRANRNALVCQCCGEIFHSIRPNAKFCTPACRQRFSPPAKEGASTAGCSIRAGTYRNKQNRITPNTAACPDEGRPLFLCSNMEVLF